MNKFIRHTAYAIAICTTLGCSLVDSSPDVEELLEQCGFAGKPYEVIENSHSESSFPSDYITTLIIKVEEEDISANPMWKSTVSSKLSDKERRAVAWLDKTSISDVPWFPRGKKIASPDVYICLKDAEFRPNAPDDVTFLRLFLYDSKSQILYYLKEHL